MISYLQNINERERSILLVGICFVLIYVFYQLLFLPLSSSLTNKATQLAEKKETLNWMQGVKQLIKTNQPSTISNSRLLSIISTQLKNTPFNSFIFQLQQTGSGDIQLSYETVPYTLFLKWLWQLSSTYAILLKQFSVERTKVTGVVKLSLILSAK